MGMHNKIDWPIDQMRAWYEDERKTVEEIGALLGRSSKAVNKACKRYGFAMRKRGPKPGKEHPCWKGGRKLDKAGYVLLHRPDHPDSNSSGYVREHRLVAEQILGRRLLASEVVHHKNDDPADNRPENLQVYETNAEHLRETLRGKCPVWSDEGLQRILESVRRERPASRRQRPGSCDPTCSEAPLRCSTETQTDDPSPL